MIELNKEIVKGVIEWPWPKKNDKLFVKNIHDQLPDVPRCQASCFATAGYHGILKPLGMPRMENNIFSGVRSCTYCKIPLRGLHACVNTELS